MVEYVYAVHNFVPENPDEIALNVGDKIEVIEKDDEYGDGWWQGKNPSGKSGLFPQAYTIPDPPASASTPPDAARTSSSAATLQALPEESESMNGSEADGAVMAATLTDVQEAIEQLGVKRDGHDDAASHSYSFSSAKEGTDADADGEEETGEFSKSARSVLAQNAIQLEQARLSERSAAPPIDFELSDESEDEDDGNHHHHHHQNPLSTNGHSTHAEHVDASPQPFRNLTVPGTTDSNNKDFYRLSTTSSSHLFAPSDTEGEADADSLLGQPIKLAPALIASQVVALPSLSSSHQEDTSPSLSQPVPPSPRTIVVSDTNKRISDSIFPSSPSSVTTRYAAGVALPTSPSPGPLPISVTPLQSSYTTPLASPDVEISESMAQRDLQQLAHRNSFKSSQPSEWSVEQVVSWLRSKNFDEGVCSKFIEHEITGDVLLELDINLLKEIDIHAFGKRMRIANAIAALRRPPSFVSSSASYTPHTSFPAPDSARQSLHSPVPVMLSPESAPHTGDLPGTPFVPPPSMRRESDPGINGEEIPTKLAGLGFAGLTSSAMTSVASDKGTYEKKGRPNSLALSPSDSALHPRAVWGSHSQKASLTGSSSFIREETEGETEQEEKAVMSEGELPIRQDKSISKKRLNPGASLESPSSARSLNESQSQPSPSQISPSVEASTPISSTTSSVKRNSKEANGTNGSHKVKKSVDIGKSSESSRLSFFGGTIGKTRKPPPRYSVVDQGSDTSPTLVTPEKSSRSLSRLYMGSTKRPSRPSTGTTVNSVHSTGTSPRSSADPTVLRKRTQSTSDTAVSPRLDPNSIGLNLKQGETALDQIGEPDHEGWMRKKGERYNSWKMRYFVLKGHHLYYLKTRSETKIKGYINILGYKIIADENVNPGRYGFRIAHDNDRTHYFSSEEQMVVREWMKALMKATIGRDYTRPVISSCNIPTIPLAVAQAMNPAPRPPSPTARDATQKALRRENPNQLSSRDARVLMGVPNPELEPEERRKLEAVFTSDPARAGKPANASTPPRPPREARRTGEMLNNVIEQSDSDDDVDLINWINSHLPPSKPRAKDLSKSLASGSILFRVTESITGKSEGVPDTDFPINSKEEKLDGMFKLFDLLMDNKVQLASISINDVRQANKEKITQLVRSIKAWEEDRKRSGL